MMLAAGLFDFESLLPLAVFGTFAAIAWWALDFMAQRRSRGRTVG